MSTLTENLQTIYEVKQEIKEVLGTSSDIFTQYPDLISAAIAGGGTTPTGTYNIAANGNYDVTSYAYAYVAVPVSPSDGSNLITAPVDSLISQDVQEQEMEGIPNGTTTVYAVNLVGRDGIVVNNFGATFEDYQAIETQVYDGVTYTYWQHSDMFTATHTTVNNQDAFTFVNQFTDDRHALRFRLYCAYNYYDDFIEDTVTGEAWTTWVRVPNTATDEE